MKFTIKLLPLLLLAGCATIFGEKSDNLTIHSNDPDAIILVDGNEVGRGSAVYSLPRDKTAIITARKKGCSDTTISTAQSLNNTTFVNTIFWPGYLVDAASGSIHKASQTNFSVTPNCSK